MKQRFIPCEEHEVQEVANLLQKLGYKEWDNIAAMTWYPQYSGVLAAADGNYFVTYDVGKLFHVTLPELRQMVAEKEDLEFQARQLPTQIKNDMTYQNYIDLGFKRVECPDDVAFEHTGHHPYSLEYRHGKTIGICIDSEALQEPYMVVNDGKKNSVRVALSVSSAIEIVNQIKSEE